MSANLKSYVDDNETIYVSDYLKVEDLGGSSSRNLTFGLDDIATLPAQSSVFVNKLTFKWSGYIEYTGTANSQKTAFFCLAGIVPRDYIVDDESGVIDLDSYQEIKGWPLKGCYGFTGISRPEPSSAHLEANTWQGNYSYSSFQKTYRPRKVLLINRLQQITFNVLNLYSTGSDFDGIISIEAQFKRAG